MNIQLQVSTPKPFSLGLDPELAKLKEIRALLDDLGRTQSMKLDLSVTGAEGLLRVKSQLDTIVAQLNAAGEGAWADKLKANLVGPEQAMAGLKARAAEMRAELNAMRAVLKENQVEFSRAANDPTYSGRDLVARPVSPSDRGKLERQPYAISNQQATANTAAFTQGINTASERIDKMAAKVAQLEAAAAGAESLVHLGKAAESTVSPMQHATQQATQHASAAEQDAKATTAQAEALDALARAKKRSAQATGDGTPGEALTSILLSKRGNFYTDAAKRGITGEFREGTKAEEWFGKAVKRGSLDALKRERDAVGDTGDSRQVLAIQKSLRRQEEKAQRDAEREAKRESAYLLAQRKKEYADSIGDTGDSRSVLGLRRSLAADEQKKQAARDAEAQRESDYLLKLRLDRHKEEEALRKQQERDAAKPGLMGKYGEKLGAVAFYTAAAATVYAALGSVKSGIEGSVHTDREMAMLGGIFRGAPGEYKGLTKDVLGIASAQGRDTDEAMEAAKKFSHLGLGRAETGQFTSLAMKAANISGVGGEESAHAVASYTEAFGLGIGGATVALDQMNSVANHTNVTIKDLMEAMSRTGAIAKATGFSLVEMSALLAGGAGKTGLPLTQFTQAFGMMLTNTTDPAKQAALKGRFGLDVYKPDGQMKSGPDLVREIHAKYEKMSPEQGLSMLSTFGGARQGQRLAAIFDNYTESQINSINAQRDLNSAQNQNAAILDTMAANLKKVESAWTSMWHSAAQGGAKGVVNGVLGATAWTIHTLDRSLGLGGAVLGGMYGGGPGVSKWIQTDQESKYMKGQDDAIEAAKTDAARKASLAAAEAQAAALFSSKANALGAGMSGAKAKSTISELARLFGGDSDANTREWNAIYAQPGGAEKLQEILSGKGGELRDRAKGASGAARDANAAQRTRIEAYDDMLAREVEQERAKGSAGIRPGVGKNANPEMPGASVNEGMIALIEARRAELKQELEELSNQRRSIPDADMDPIETRQTRSARRMLGIGYGAIGDFFSQVPLGSRWQTAKVDRDQRGLGAQNSWLMGFKREHPLVDTIQQETDLVMRREQLDQQRLTAGSKDRITRGTMDANIGLEAFGAGRNHTEQLMDVMRGISQSSQGLDLRRGIGGWAGVGTAPEHAAGEAIALSLRLEETKEKVLERQASIQRELNQLKIDENREAAKAFAFASRGDQLTAALMRRHYEQNGKMGSGEFQYGMSEHDRGVMARMMPDAMPDVLGQRGRLLKEQSQIPDALKKIDDLTNSLKPVLDRAGNLNGLQGAAPPIQFPQVNVNVDAAGQIGAFLQSTQEMMSAVVDAKFEALTAQVSDWVMQMRGQGAGSDSILGA